jgi:integrase
VDAIVAVGTFNVRQDQKRHERPVQPHDPSRYWLRKSDSPGATERETRENSFGIDSRRNPQVVAALPLKESTLVFFDAATGLRMSELFGLKWGDVMFGAGEVSVIRSIVQQVAGAL